MLMRAYRRLLADDCQSQVHTNSANNSALPQDGVHLDKKLQETLTLASSETRKIQFISNEIKTKQQHNSGDGIVDHLLEDKGTENCEDCSGCDKISQENSVHSETLSESRTHASSIGEDTATNPRNNSGNTHEPPYPLKLKLLTCCIKTRLVSILIFCFYEDLHKLLLFMTLQNELFRVFRCHQPLL